VIDRQKLLADLKPILKEVEADLRARCDEVPQIDADLKSEYEQARAADRTGVTYEEWRADLITQVGVAWVLSCVFVRFLEDNALIVPPRIAGPLHGAAADLGLMRARDERETYFKAHAKQTDRDYLLSVFDDLARLPATKDVFGPHNTALIPAYRDWLSGDAAQKLIEFFQKVDTDGTGELIHDFTEDAGGTQAGGWGRRYLGDLYQDLSELARKKYALLQTPVFIEEFILDRTLEPAIQEFGLENFRMIDPACGSGHFLLGGFARLLLRWRQRDPGANHRELINRAIASVYGVDLNPYAIIVTRFRLLLAVMQEYGITKLKEAPAVQFNLACGDSLLHGERPFTGGVQGTLDPHDPNTQHVYSVEDRSKLVEYLRHGQYHAVVANPPYITPKDARQNANIRARYSSCHMKYALAVPFMERIFDLAVQGTTENGYRCGFTGQITSNSFMKREFGKKLVESYIPRWDITHVIDTSGAYIPGHGTPTVILFGRNRHPVAPTIRAVMGIKGEPATPDDPSQGLVWTAITNQIDQVGSQSAFVSVNDTPRGQFGKHPWSIGGGGASELKEQLDSVQKRKLSDLIVCAGFSMILGEDDAFSVPRGRASIDLLPPGLTRPVVEGELVRDWSLNWQTEALFPYNSKIELIDNPAIHRWLWSLRVLLGGRRDFSQRTYRECGRPYHEYHQIPIERNRTLVSIVFAEVATHNHFVLDRGGKVFKQTAPVIKLPAEATEDDHLAVLGLLNSSIACFWMRQVCFPKGGDHVGQEGARVRKSIWDERHAFNATNLEQFPISQESPLALAKLLDRYAIAYAANLPENVCRVSIPNGDTLAEAWQISTQILGQMIATQEELDWECYRLYGLLPDPPLHLTPPTVYRGQRAFEIVLARRIAAGEEESTWFERHGSTPITEIPSDWPDDYRNLVQRRIEIIESDANIALIERPEYKRRWNTEPWDQQQERALRGWLLDRLESYFDLEGRMTRGVSTANVEPTDASTVNVNRRYAEPKLTNVGTLADFARADKEFMQVAEIFTGRMDFAVGVLVGELIAAESVPVLPVLRYKPAAMDKRRAWERTWELQRQEDRINAEVEQLGKQAEPEKNPTAAVQLRIANLKSQLPSIPVPPKYTSADFLSGNVWHLRGKLDVPKERWVSFPHCDGEDGTLVIAWAGYDHLQLARAIAERYELAKENEGHKLVPLLTAIGELIPWLKQWHNDPNMAFGGTRMGKYFEEYLAQEAKVLGMSVEQVRAWAPPAKVKKVKKAERKVVPVGAGGFPDSDRDVLLITAGLSLVGTNGISEDLHLDSLILMTTPERCRAMTSDTSKFDSIIKGINSEFWTETGAKWKQTRDLLRHANAIEVDVHSGQITRKEPVFSKLRNQFGKSLDDLARVAINAARSIQNATSTIQNDQNISRQRERGAA